jgi:hypothetical protein
MLHFHRTQETEEDRSLAKDEETVREESVAESEATIEDFTSEEVAQKQRFWETTLSQRFWEEPAGVDAQTENDEDPLPLMEALLEELDLTDLRDQDSEHVIWNWLSKVEQHEERKAPTMKTRVVVEPVQDASAESRSEAFLMSLNATLQKSPRGNDRAPTEMQALALLLTSQIAEQVEVAQSYEVNGRYKPVAKKVRPLEMEYPSDLNAPMKHPPMSRDPYSSPLTPQPPVFEFGGRLTKERLVDVHFGPEGFLTDQEKTLLLHVLRLRERALAFDESERGLLKATYAAPYKFATVPHTPWQLKPMHIPPAIRQQLIDLLKERLRTGLYERAQGGYSSKWFPVPKKNGKLRIVHCLEPLNAVTIRDAAVPPDADDFLESLTGRAVFGLIDIMGGFDERDLDRESRPLTAFQTPVGYLQLCRLPQGYTNSVQEQMRVSRHVLGAEIPEHADCFMDDLPVKGPRATPNDEDSIDGNPDIRRFIWDYAVTLERILFRLEEAGLTAAGKVGCLRTRTRGYRPYRFTLRKSNKQRKEEQNIEMAVT